jgi:hypothetical protein
MTGTGAYTGNYFERQALQPTAPGAIMSRRGGIDTSR